MPLVAANTSMYVNVSSNASNLVFWYHTPWAFDWHPLVSAVPFVAAFPAKAILVSYPASSSGGLVSKCTAVANPAWWES